MVDGWRHAMNWHSSKTKFQRPKPSARGGGGAAGAAKREWEGQVCVPTHMKANCACASWRRRRPS
eukprot:2536299-Alexandrium_andersonii.AAC.1